MARIVLALVLWAGLFSAAQAQDASQPDELVETYRDWTVRCVTPSREGATRQCIMVAQAMAEDGQRVVYSVGLRRLDDGATVMTVTTPLGVRLADGVVISVEDIALPAAPFVRCLPRGCIANLRVSEENLDLFRAGANLTVRTVIGPERSIARDISLLGFSAAFTRLGEL